MLLVIFYLIFVVLALVFTSKIYRFLRIFYSKPFLTNTYAEFIPSSKIIEEKIIVNKSGSYSVVIKLKGFSYHKEHNLEEAKQNSFKIKERALNFRDLEENIQIKFLFKRAKEKESYNNTNYIELTSNNLKQLKDTLERLKSSLNVFRADVLEGKELLEFLFLNANLVTKDLDVSSGINIDDLCSYSSVTFEGDYGVLSNIETKKYFKCLSFNFGSIIDDKYFKDLVTANIEFDFIINTKFFDKINASKVINTDKKNISTSNDESKKGGVTSGAFNSSKKKISEIAEAQEILDNEDSNLAVFDCFLVVFAAKEEELNKSISIIKEIISKHEIFLVEETYLLNFFFLQRLIGFSLVHKLKYLAPYSDILVYAKKVLSSTVAGLFDYIDMPKGLSKCDWGVNPLASFSTNYNNLYNFYLHVSEEKAAVGHGVIIAPTGGGKTTFIQYAMKGILENYQEVDVYSFDKFNGISVFTNWQKGRDVNFGDLAINPLQIDLEVEENLDFLHSFLSILSKPETPEDSNILNNFINALTLMDKKDRVLTNLVNNSLLPESNIKSNLDIWVNGKYSKYINAEEDNFTLDSNFLNFQMDKILDDEELFAPILYYIMFKIRQKARSTSRGHFVFIDEAAAMLKNSYFQSQIEVLLQEHRKLRGCVWLAFQNSNSFLEDKKLKDLILNQCQNQILFSSNAIKESTLKALNIDETIYNELLATQKNNHNPYYVLLKKPSENIILNINMKEKLGEDLKFLSSSMEDVNKMRKLEEEFGEEWIEHY